MTALKPLSGLVVIDCSVTNLNTDPRTLNELELYNATKVRITNESNEPILVYRCTAQGNHTDTGNANFIQFEAGQGLGVIYLPIGESIVLAKEAGSAKFDVDAGEYVANPPVGYHGEVFVLDEKTGLSNTGAPTSGFIYASAVSTVY